MAKKRLPPPEAPELRSAIPDMVKEKGRAGAVIAAAWVDDALHACLEAYFARDKEISKQLLRLDGPIGTFGLRIKIAYLLGIISDDVRHDLDIIREVRKRFCAFAARSLFPISSDSRQV